MMKKLGLLLVGVLALVFTACTSPKTGLGVDVEGYPYVYSIEEGDTGDRYSSDDLDELRGMGYEKAAEAMKFSNILKEKRLGNPTHEAWGGHPDWDGTDAIVTDVSDYTSEEIANLLDEYGGMYYTGRVKTRAWEYKGKWYFLTTQENMYKKGNGGSLFPVLPNPTSYVHGWQGFNPPVGYYPNGLANEPWIEGPEPKIKGSNYEKNKTPDWAK